MGTGGSPAPKAETEGLPVVWFDFPKPSPLNGDWPSDPSCWPGVSDIKGIWPSSSGEGFRTKAVVDRNQ